MKWNQSQLRLKTRRYEINWTTLHHEKPENKSGSWSASQDTFLLVQWFNPALTCCTCPSLNTCPSTLMLPDCLEPPSVFLFSMTACLSTIPFLPIDLETTACVWLMSCVPNQSPELNITDLFTSLIVCTVAPSQPEPARWEMVLQEMPRGESQ